MTDDQLDDALDDPTWERHDLLLGELERRGALDPDLVRALLESGYTLERAVGQAEFIARRRQLRLEGKLEPERQTNVPLESRPPAS